MADYKSSVQQMLQGGTLTLDEDNAETQAIKELLKQVKVDFLERSPLLSYRSWCYEHKIMAQMTRSLEGHKSNIEQHLVRLYRVRNKLIHEARFDAKYQNLTSNLKYYLTTSLSLLIDYFYKEHLAKRHCSIEDYYTHVSTKTAYWFYKKCAVELVLAESSDYGLLG